MGYAVGCASRKRCHCLSRNINIRIQTETDLYVVLIVQFGRQLEVIYLVPRHVVSTRDRRCTLSHDLILAIRDSSPGSSVQRPLHDEECRAGTCKRVACELKGQGAVYSGSGDIADEPIGTGIP